MSDLLQVVRDGKNSAHQILALRGYIDLVGRADSMKAEEKVQCCKTALSLASNAAEKRRVFAVLTNVKTVESLQLAASGVRDEQAQEEAALAVVAIAKDISAGNAGPGSQTIGTPAVAKNVIATGAAQNNRFDFFIYADGQEAMADFSSRGPCEDGRIKPDITAPGTWIASLRSALANDENAWSPISDNYLYQGGTSQAGPHVSGGAAVFVQYYKENHGGAKPSPALPVSQSSVWTCGNTLTT